MDKSVIQRRQGLQAFNPMIFEKIDNMTLAGRISNEIQEFKPDAVFIDAGRGEGVIDRLRQLGYSIIEVNFGGTALNNNHYENRRSEMWDLLKQWLEAGGCIPNNSQLKSELVTPSYSLNKRDRFQLESKDDIKKRLGHSCDLSDALALTFAMPVASSADVGHYSNRQQFATTVYNPIQRNNNSRQFANSPYNPIQSKRRR